MNTIKGRWNAFISSVIDPWVILLLLATVALGLALTNQTNATMVATFTVLVSLSSGVLGGLVGKRWEDITGEGATKARGKTAIRSLKLLFGSTAALERRTRLYLSRYTKARKRSSASDIVSTYLEDVIERCTSIEEEVLSSIENWTDIIPDADVNTQIGLITELKLKVEGLTANLKHRTADLKETKGRSKAEIDRLTREKEDKEKELASARRELAQRSFSFGPPISSGVIQPGIIPYIPSPSTVVITGTHPSLSSGYTEPIFVPGSHVITPSRQSSS